MILLALLTTFTASAQVIQPPTPAFEVKSRREPSVFEDKPIPKTESTKKLSSNSGPVKVINEVADSDTLTMPTEAPVQSSATPFIEIKLSKEKFNGLRRSTVVKARISDSITAYEGAKDPVKAVITDGEFKGSILFGTATMDKVTKNAIVAFDTFIPKGSNETYKMLGTIKDQDGNSGLVGVLESRYWETFFLQFGLNTASAAANSTTQYTQTTAGNYNAVPGSDSAIKQGLAGGFNKMAEKVERDSASRQDYTTVQGPVYIRVYILEQPEKY